MSPRIWVVVGFGVAQGVLLYLLTDVSIWIAAAAAVLSSLAITIAGVALFRPNRQPRAGHSEPYDATIEEFFYVLKWNVAGQLIDANEMYLERIGYTLEELRALPRHQIDDENASLSEMWPLVRSGKSWSGEFCDQAKDGSLVWMSAIVVPVRDAEGVLQSLTTVGVDVSDKRRAQQALKEANSRLQAFVKHAPAAVAMFDNDMRYVAYTDREPRRSDVAAEPAVVQRTAIQRNTIRAIDQRVVRCRASRYRSTERGERHARP